MELPKERKITPDDYRRGRIYCDSRSNNSAFTDLTRIGAYCRSNVSALYHPLTEDKESWQSDMEISHSAYVL